MQFLKIATVNTTLGSSKIGTVSSSANDLYSVHKAILDEFSSGENLGNAIILQTSEKSLTLMAPALLLTVISGSRKVFAL
ncbi:hypothetical protein TNCV_2771881 [Trichonephila clavipes]|nr:hypothetical protein TNCV_2771881 [Trichonephila clavipes]